MRSMKLVVVLLVLCLSLASLAGCGVSKGKYETLLNDKIALEEKVANLTKARDAMRNEYDNLLNQKMDLATKVTTLTNEKAALKGEYDKILDEKISVKAAYDKLLADIKGSQQGASTEKPVEKPVKA